MTLFINELSSTVFSTKLAMSKKAISPEINLSNAISFAALNITPKSKFLPTFSTISKAGNFFLSGSKNSSAFIFVKSIFFKPSYNLFG